MNTSIPVTAIVSGSVSPSIERALEKSASSKPLSSRVADRKMFRENEKMKEMQHQLG